MGCPKCTVMGLLQFILGLMTFLVGYKLGLDRNIPRCLPSVAQKLEVVNPVSNWKSIPIARRTFQLHKIYNPVIAETVFPDLYHPARIEKSEFLLSASDNWQNVSNPRDPFLCDEIYNTRVGSRQNQPSKCVAVVSVADGYQSPWKQIHRTGVTAGTCIYRIKRVLMKESYQVE